MTIIKKIKAWYLRPALLWQQDIDSLSVCAPPFIVTAEAYREQCDLVDRFKFALEVLASAEMGEASRFASEYERQVKEIAAAALAGV